MGRKSRNSPYSREEKIKLFFQRSKAQAKFRNELWQLSWEEFYALWSPEGRFERSGRGSDSLVLTRKDYLNPWSKDNVVILIRKISLQLAHRKQMKKPHDDLLKGAISL